MRMSGVLKIIVVITIKAFQIVAVIHIYYLLDLHWPIW